MHPSGEMTLITGLLMAGATVPSQTGLRRLDFLWSLEATFRTVGGTSDSGGQVASSFRIEQGTILLVLSLIHI